MSRTNRNILYLEMPDYLGQWLCHDYWNAEGQYISFPRGSAPMVILLSLLRRSPEIVNEPTQGSVPILLPTFKGIPEDAFNYLSKAGQIAFVSACKTLFKSVMFSELNRLFDQKVQITNIIYDFMDRHGIEPEERNWETIRQMYMRMRKKSLLMRNV